MQQVTVAIVGSGYAARLRTKAIAAEPRTRLLGIAASSLDRAKALTVEHGGEAWDNWEQMLERMQPDLVVVANENDRHAAIARASLEQGCHTVVEYPLALDPAEAEALVQLARDRQRLLHIEHIELLGGVHRALKEHLPRVGTVRQVLYRTVAPKRPVGDRWSFRRQRFGFPLVGALSRVHRLTDAFGPVTAVSADYRTWPEGEDLYRDVWCRATLEFASGAIGELVYAKGESVWQPERRLEVQGLEGALTFAGETGELTTAAGPEPLTVGGRRGLFGEDTRQVVDHLLTGSPLYLQPEQSLYALRVADACRRAAEQGCRISV